MNIEQLKELKRELGLTNEDISKTSGVPLGTVQKIFAGVTRSPRKITLIAIETALMTEKQGRPDYTLNDFLTDKERDSLYSGVLSSMVRETPAAYGTAPALDDPRQGSYTLEDYYTLPEDRRVELIDGYFFDMSAPTGYHQIIAGQLHAMFLSFIQSRKGTCMPFIAPVDVRLDCDNKTILQPDVLILCDRSKYTPLRIEGAPDLVVEVLSPSTKSKDMFIKLNKYRKAGVREYWMIDPKKKQILVWMFGKEEDVTSYGFRDLIPVGIFGGELSIDFSAIDDVVSEWMT